MQVPECLKAEQGPSFVPPATPGFTFFLLNAVFIRSQVTQKPREVSEGHRTFVAM